MNTPVPVEVAACADYLLKAFRDDLHLWFDVNDPTHSNVCIATAFLTDGYDFLNVIVADHAVLRDGIVAFQINETSFTIAAGPWVVTRRSYNASDLEKIAKAALRNFEQLAHEERRRTSVKLLSFEIQCGSGDSQDKAKDWLSMFATHIGGDVQTLPRFMLPDAEFSEDDRAKIWAQVTLQGRLDERDLIRLMEPYFFRADSLIVGKNLRFIARPEVRSRIGIDHAFILTRRF